MKLPDIFKVFKRKKEEEIKCCVCNKPIDINKDIYKVINIGENRLYICNECYKKARKEAMNILNELIKAMRSRR